MRHRKGCPTLANTLSICPITTRLIERLHIKATAVIRECQKQAKHKVLLTENGVSMPAGEYRMFLNCISLNGKPYETRLKTRSKTAYCIASCDTDYRELALSLYRPAT
jgi:hypothetical protein